jgi:hypothetical protein
MNGLVAALVGALVLGALNTFGDFLWARFVSRHTAMLGLAHGTILLLALGLYLGVLRKRWALGAIGGAVVGLLAAASFYAIAPLLGMSAMFVSWMALWIGFAFLDARLRGGAPPRETLVRGVLAAIFSGLAFYSVSGIWTRHDPGGPNYAWNYLCWTVAFLPGLVALVVSPKPRP